jgi:hypothetical protein
LFNPTTGQENGERSWGNAGNWNAFLPLDGARFFVQDDDWARVYSKEFEEVAANKLQVNGDMLPRFSVSPSGRTLYEFQDGYDRRRGWITRIDVLNPDTLETNDSAFTPVHSDDTVGDSKVVYSLPSVHDFLRLFVYKLADGPEPNNEPLLKEKTLTAKNVAKSGCRSATLISDSVMAITGGCTKVMLLRGDEEFDEVEFSEYRIGAEVRPSSDGRRFAFARFPKKDSPKKITRVELCVYDLGTKRLVFNEVISPLPQQKFAFALSPDGSFVAALSDNVLRVWRLQGPTK